MSQELTLKAALKHQDALLTYAYGVTRDWGLAEDIVQNALVTVMEKASTFQEGTNLYAWVKAIVRLKTLEMLRSKGRERSLADDQLIAMVDTILDRELDEESSRRQSVLLSRLRECLARASTSAVGLLHGFYIDGKSYYALAQDRNIELETIRKQFHRLRKQLRECVEKQQLDTIEEQEAGQ